MTAFEPSPIGEVGTRAAGDRWTLVFVRDLRHPPEKVWAALTEPERLRAWAPYAADVNLGTPGKATLTMLEGDEPVGEGLVADVRRAEAPVLLEHTWGGDVLRWELAPTGSGTQLTLSHTVEDRDWLPKVAAGWHICLDVAERLLDGRAVSPIRGEQARRHGWDELNEAYTRKLF
jgi:uncharacterized protein YndB with AHSA1/START domain